VHPFSWTRNVVRRNFGTELEAIFENFDEVPIGSGSVAQVHRARTRDGLDVAVKVLHPNATELFQVDLELLNLLANVAHRIPAFTWLHIPEELAYFRSAMHQQLDLRFEAYTLAVFRRNFSHSRTVAFPEPIASTKEVLVESFEEGLPISFFTQNKSDDPTWSKMKNEIARCGLESFLQMLLWDNFVHADLHPGNMLIKFPHCPSELPRTCEEACLAYSQGYKPTLVFIDTGLITELSSRDFTNFTDLFKALVLRADGYLAGRLILDRGPSSGSVAGWKVLSLQCLRIALRH
jgi:aarF domain-containing kinase